MRSNVCEADIRAAGKADGDRSGRRRAGRPLVAAAIACLAVAALAPAAARAQGAPQPPPPGTPTGAVRGQCAALFDISVSPVVRKKIDTALQRLPNAIYDQLQAADVDTLLIAPTAKPAYDPPGDDELSFASVGDIGQEVVERIQAGFPELNGPLILMSVAERGAYVIASAYVFYKDANDHHVLRRLDRDVVSPAEATSAKVEKQWSPCFALKALEFFEKSKFIPSKADFVRPVCPPPQQAAAGKTAQTAAAKAAPAPQKGAGMLDDVPDLPFVSIIPPTAPGQKATPPAVTAPKLPSVIVLAPSTQTAPGTLPAAVPSIPPQGGNDMLAPGLPRILEQFRNLTPNQIEAKIADDVFRLGLIWVPRRDSQHHQMLRWMFERHIKSTGSVGSCFASLLEGARSRSDLIDQLMKELGRHSSAHLSFARKGNDQIVVTFGTSALGGEADMGRNCLRPNTAIMAQKLEIQIPMKATRPGTASNQSTFIYYSDYRLNEIDAELKSWSEQKGRKLRLPIGHEAFMIATAIAYRQTVIEEPEVNFWFRLDQKRYGFFKLKVGANRNIELADYDIAETPVSDKRKAAMFFIVGDN